MLTSPILLSDVVAQVESNNNPLAMRFEEAAYKANSPTAASHLAIHRYATGGYVSLYTAHMIAYTSWGKYQIMGYNLYGKCGWQHPLADFLITDDAQIAMFRRFIAPKFSDVPFPTMAEHELLAFAKMYNGNGPVYSDALKTAYREMTA